MIRQIFCILIINPLYIFTEMLNRKFGKVKLGPIWYAEDMPWMKVLEDNHNVVLEEFERYRATLSRLPDLEDLRTQNNKTDFGSGRWDMLYLRINNRKNEELSSHFPKTVKLLEENVPELFSIRFSLLGSNRKEITPHRDGHNQCVICHLPLIVPEGECSITINDIRQPWEEGKCFAFDASALHYVTKESDGERLVVLIDTFRPVPKWVKALSRFVFNYQVKNAPVEEIFQLHGQAISKAQL
ncbi:aspartyl/asparaginyl beta-hydroxylase domain-containing protein [Microbulbifer sp. ANSA003]|uniref:aspartyl/asparaginyl beta-hydroxylase domain-containing protein n=1 Tax=Microbulbifer sp. ANSA003 TaxID=3243360 RepID=UPI0040431A3B